MPIGAEQIYLKDEINLSAMTILEKKGRSTK